MDIIKVLNPLGCMPIQVLSQLPGLHRVIQNIYGVKVGTEAVSL